MRIALISPNPWPAQDDVAHHLGAEAHALARRGHRVTILAPATRRELIAAGRSLVLDAQAGDADALSPPPGQVLEVALGRALPAGAGRRVGEPFDLAATLETLLSRVPFDIVHLHEPLAPSPALAALRHAPGVTAATFHRAEPLVGVAFLRPLVDRALARADLRIATTEVGREALSEILPGDYGVIPSGVNPHVFRPTDGTEPAGLVLVARGRDRVGVRFALGLLRSLDLATLGPVTLLGPADAPWRTRAAVPKALRETVDVIPDAGPASRAAILGSAAIALLAGPDDASGPVLREALASGCAVIAPRCAAITESLTSGTDALVLRPFTREPWIKAVRDLVADPERRGHLQAAARKRGCSRSWDDVASDIEGAYRTALEAARNRPVERRGERVLADLHVRPGGGLSPDQIVAACVERGIEVVAVASPDGLDPARAVAAAAPPGLTTIIGQEVATSDGIVIGLFLTHPVAAGSSLEDATEAIRSQGGLVMTPHPDRGAPSPAGLRAVAGGIDCYEVVAGADGASDAIESALRRLGMLVCAGSGASRAEDVGAALTELRRFEGPTDLLDALTEADLRRADGGATIHEPRSRRRRRRSPKS